MGNFAIFATCSNYEKAKVGPSTTVTVSAARGVATNVRPKLGKEDSGDGGGLFSGGFLRDHCQTKSYLRNIQAIGE